MPKTKPKKVPTKKSEILQEALKHLSPHLPDKNSNREEYICHAVGKVVNPSDPYESSHPVQKEIVSRLGGWFSFETWLLSNGVSSQELWEDRQKGQVKFQKHRKQWILSMIEEFKAQGD